MTDMAFQGHGPAGGSRKPKSSPPEETLEEAAYLKSLGEKQKAVSIKLADGEIVHGWIEYYDKNMIRLTREGAPNLFIFKHEIMYIAEGTGRESARKREARTANTRASGPESPSRGADE